MPGPGRSLLIVALALVAGPLATAPGAQAATVTAGALRAEISEDPWRITLTDAAGQTVLSEHPGTGAAPTGTLGFRAAGVWRHATRVLSSSRAGDAYVARLATTDPLRTVDVRLEPGADGVIALEASVVGPGGDLQALGVGFRERDGERYLGFGERSNAIDQRGNTVENYVAEGPYQLEERPFITAFVPRWGYQPRDDATYFPIPWLLSTAGYGVLVDNTETSYFRLGSDASDAWSVEVQAAPTEQPEGALAPPPRRLALRFFAGPRPADVLRRYTAATGRQPAPAAPWYLGPWFQPTGTDGAQVAQLARLRERDAPVSVAQTYTHYLPCGDQRGREAAERARIDALHAAGAASTTYFNPMLCTTYDPDYGEAAARGALTKRQDGSPYTYRYSTADNFEVAQYDFSAASGRELFAGQLRRAFNDGHDGWMEDFGEYTPLDSVSANGMGGTEMHNLYPRLYHCSAYDFARTQGRPVGRFIRSGFSGVAPCAQIVWGGDPTTDWGFDGLASSVKNGLTMGLSGISTWGSDIGGFFSLGSRRLTPELYRRWIQFGAVSGVMRTQEGGIALPPKSRPKTTDEEILPTWRRYAKMRTQLYPYLVAADAEYRREGIPMMRHLALTYPDDARASAREDEFLFGPDLLAAPVLEPGARRRELYLPAGEWVDLWRSAAYDEAGDGGLDLAGRARLVEGGRSMSLPAPEDELPLLARAGTVLPLLPPDVDTLAAYGDRPGLVKLDDRRNRVDLLAFPRGDSSADFYEGERLSSRERRGRWELGIDGSRARRYSLQASLATLRRPLAPCRVTVGGRALPRADWSYRASDGVLEATFRARSTTLVASARCSAGQGNGQGEGGGRERPARDRQGGGSASTEPAPVVAESGGLPFTGLALLLIAGLGLSAAAAGLVLSRIAARRNQ